MRRPYAWLRHAQIVAPIWLCFQVLIHFPCYALLDSGSKPERRRYPGSPILEETKWNTRSSACQIMDHHSGFQLIRNSDFL